MNALRDRFSSFFYGLTLPAKAFRLIFSSKRLLAWSALPIALTLALSVWGVSFLKAKLLEAGIRWLGSLGYAPDSFTAQAAAILMQILLFILAAISFSLLAGIIASPFNDFLAESAEPYADPPLPAAPSGFGGKLRAVVIDIAKTAAVTVVQIFLIFVGILAFWIPGLNLIPFAAAVWLLTFQFVGYPQTRRGEGLIESARFLTRYFFATLGFGTAIAFLFAIPVLSAFALPLAVVGGTLLYARAGAPADSVRRRLR